MKEKLLRVALPILCLGLVQCTANTTTTDGPPTAFALWRFTAAGALDTTFPGGAPGQKGFTFTNIASGVSSFVLAAAIQPADSKIVVGGSAGFSGQGAIALARYNSNGTLDTTFNSTGTVPGTVQAPLSTPAAAATLSVQGDGKIVVAAVTFAPSTSVTGIALLRYNTNGTLDSAFGTGGLVNNATIGPGLAGDTCALALQLDGKILVAGASQNGNVVVYRYSGADGSADMGFGTNGSVTTNLGAGNVAMSPAMGLLSDNSIVVATGNSLDQVLLHYTTAGALDLTYGGTANGIVKTDAGGQNFANALAIQSDDKIVVVGHANVSTNTSDISLTRYNANGTLDTSFVGPVGNPVAGVVVTNLGAFENVFSVALQDPAATNTNILVSGNVGFGNPQALLLRYDTTGKLDTTTFNSPSGFFVSQLFGPSIIASGNVVLQTSSGIVVAGYD